MNKSLIHTYSKKQHNPINQSPLSHPLSFYTNYLQPQDWRSKSAKHRTYTQTTITRGKFHTQGLLQHNTPLMKLGRGNTYVCTKDISPTQNQPVLEISHMLSEYRNLPFQYQIISPTSSSKRGKIWHSSRKRGYTKGQLWMTHPTYTLLRNPLRTQVPNRHSRYVSSIKD